MILHKYTKSLLLLTSLSLTGFTFASPSPVVPSDILPDGVDKTISVNPWTGEKGMVRKGTVAATLNNIFVLNSLLKEEKLNTDEIDVYKDSMESLISSLNYVGMFDIFSVDDWLRDDLQPGKQLVAILYLKEYTGSSNAFTEKKLKQLAESNTYFDNLIYKKS